MSIHLTTKEVEEIIGDSFESTAHKCHGVSHAIVKSGVIPADLKPRVARGMTPGVFSQHSWVVLGGDCYNEDADIIDAVLWSYDDRIKGVYHGMQADRPHVPHGGDGNIWEYGQPPDPTGPILSLSEAASEALSFEARSFLKLCGEDGLDWQGWSFLANGPVRGWPAAEIIAAMDDSPALAPIVPIDRLGMLTDRNPQGLYF